MAGIALAIAAYQAVNWGRQAGPPDQAPPRARSSSPTVADERDHNAIEAAAVAADPSTPAAPEGSGANEVVAAMTPAQRNHVFWLTITDAGYDCDEVLEAQALGVDAAVWRASCGRARVYWVAVDEFGHYTAEPAAYGDIDRPVPDQTLELRERRE